MGKIAAIALRVFAARTVAAITTCRVRFILPVRIAKVGRPARKMQPDPRRHTPIPNPWEKLPRHRWALVRRTVGPSITTQPSLQA